MSDHLAQSPYVGSGGYCGLHHQYLPCRACTSAVPMTVAMPAQNSVGPFVKGKCPACRTTSLFVGAGGYITCGNLKCPNPTAVADLLDGRAGET